MKLTPGEIYFVRERDVKSGEISPYVKIGIVREGAKGPRTSEERLLEHQTGNPRELFLHEVIATPAVEEIETRLHRAFAEHGVSGECRHVASLGKINQRSYTESNQKCVVRDSNPRPGD